MKKYFIMMVLLSSIQSLCAQNLKVMSYNIRHGTDAKNKDNLDAMGEFIKLSGADIVGVQEVDSVCRRSGNVDQMKRLATITGMHYVFVRHYAYDGGAYGLGILSKYPISELQNSRLTLLKPTARSKDLALASAVITLPTQHKVLFSTAHFGLDVPTRILQAKETLSYLKSNNMPVIFTGDLNAEPSTLEMATLKKYFVDIDAKDLHTFPVDKPVKKIDYIFVNKKSLKEVKSYNVFDNNKLSDHLPMLAELELKVKQHKKLK